MQVFGCGMNSQIGQRFIAQFGRQLARGNAKGKGVAKSSQCAVARGRNGIGRPHPKPGAGINLRDTQAHRAKAHHADQGFVIRHRHTLPCTLINFKLEIVLART